MAISASAGSGKTYRLATRYISLMARDIPPERIIALTFSRKAAGEIFSKIVQRLAEAAINKDKLHELAKALGEEGVSVDKEQVFRLLQMLMFKMPLVAVSTLDSFFVRILRNFPFEFGINGGLQIFEGHEESTVKDQVLNAMLYRGLLNSEAQKTLLENFKRATFGREEKGVGNTIRGFIDEHHQRYLSAPNVALWGDSDIIWNGNNTYVNSTSDFSKEDLHAISKALERAEITDGQRQRWAEFIETYTTHQPGTPIPKAMGYLLDKLIESRDSLSTGKTKITVDRKSMLIGADLGQLCQKLLHSLMGSEYRACLHKTKGIFHLLDAYEKNYSEYARGIGKMGFSDILYLLSSDENDTLALACTRREQRLAIDYRLDCSFDHWLIDEFQDTSTPQWLAIHNLVSEVLQSNTGTRSLFYVGDVKQSIYSWRGGDRRLFDLIKDNYQEAITSGNLTTSWRSAPEIINAVNTVFGGLEGITADKETWPDVVQRWHQHWQKHTVAAPNSEKKGFVGLYQVAKTDDASSADNIESRFELVAKLLKTLPADRQLSRAVLVRRNSTGRSITEYLREKGIHAVWEGDVSITNNAVIPAMLSLVKLAEHPGDTMALRHLEMTPINQLISAEGGNPYTFARTVLDDISEHGYEHLFRKIGKRLTEHLPHLFDGFIGDRFAEFLDAARTYELTGRRDAMDFIQYIRDYATSDQAGNHSVQVMTIHKAKGLEFDAVFLPDLQDSGVLAGADAELVIKSDNNLERTPRWALSFPTRRLAAADEVLSATLAELDSEAAYDALCVLYVAMTRASRGLYMVTSEPGAYSRTLYMSTILKQSLKGQSAPVEGLNQPATQLFAAGTENWWESDTPKQTPKTPTAASIVPPISPAAYRPEPLERQLPSEVQHPTIPAAKLFLGKNEAIDFGSAIHSLFEKVEWADKLDANAVAQEWIKTAPWPRTLTEAVAKEFCRAIATPEIRQALSRPKENAELWRERSFEVVLGKRWVSGTFDRVVIIRDQNGQPTTATIIDFKSNQIANAAELSAYEKQYEQQMQLYRAALAELLNLPPDAITTKLLFIRF